MKNILVPTDFSPCSVNALNYAGELCNYIDAKIYLLHVYHIPVPAGEIAFVNISDEAEEKKYAILMAEIIAKEKEKNNWTADVKVLCNMDFSVDGIVNSAVENKIDLIVMGQRGKTTFADRVLGSTATAMISRSRCPVLLIPENVKFNVPKNIAVACDLKHRQDEKKLAWTVEFAKKLNAKMLLFSVLNADESYVPQKATEYDYIENIVGEGRHSMHFPVHEDIHEGILNFIDEHKAEMMVMFPHKHNIFEHLFSRLNSGNISQQIKVPLLLLNDYL